VRILAKRTRACDVHEAKNRVCECACVRGKKSAQLTVCLFQILTLSCLNSSHHDAKSLNGSSQPLLYQFLPVYFQSTSSFFQSTSSVLLVYFQFTSSLLRVYFQSISSLLPVYFQFSSRLQPTSKSTILCQIFDFL
jgi:hypothetical protein